ncbi:hypothetical protein BDW22DRAFT_1340393 [Trametopsis cervina]|nr:hypothetical protein BDW22DRAFT_1340393 [Trametopsis cervina]
MNQTNITISHFSPLITYVPAMIWGDAANDPLAAEYWGQGYHSTNSSNGQGRLFFTWYGTGTRVHGGYRSRLGPYQVVVDSHVVAEFAGYQRGDIEATDAVLFNSTGLRTGPHILEIINTSDDANRPVLDINRIVYQHNVGDARNITAADPQCRWSSSTNASSPIWHSVSGSKTTYSSIGSMNISFTVRTGIMLYGLVGPSNSPFLVTVDGTPQVMYPNTQPNTNSTEPHVLYTIDGLEPAQEHVLSVRNNPVFSSQSGASTTLNIHHAVVLDSSNGYALVSSPVV